MYSSAGEYWTEASPEGCWPRLACTAAGRAWDSPRPWRAAAPWVSLRPLYTRDLWATDFWRKRGERGRVFNRSHLLCTHFKGCLLWIKTIRGQQQVKTGHQNHREGRCRLQKFGLCTHSSVVWASNKDLFFLLHKAEVLNSSPRGPLHVLGMGHYQLVFQVC